MLHGLNEIAESIRATFDVMDQAREKAYVTSRQVIREASVCIKHLHREEADEAAAKLAQTRALVDEMSAAVAQAPALGYGGFVTDAEKEYAEAALLLACVAGKALPTPEELGITGAAWLNGLSEVVGELRRYVLDRIRLDDPEKAEEYLETMEEAYQVIMSFDYPNAISLGLRGRTDAARGLIERTRGDLTNALQAKRLAQQMAGLQARLDTLETDGDDDL